MKNEAIQRMKKLRIKQHIVDDFERNGKLWCSDHGKMVEVPPNILAEIKEWQDQFDNLVYHVIHGDFICETYECLSVSCYKEDWDYERGLIEDNWVMSHSINVSTPLYTESGSIKVKNIGGVLQRIN